MRISDWSSDVCSSDLAEYLAGAQVPLLIAADDRLEGRFRQLNKYGGLVEAAIRTNPDALSDTELHDRAYAIMQPAFERTLRDAVDHFNALAGDGAERIANGIDQIGRAACRERVCKYV